MTALHKTNILSRQIQLFENEYDIALDEANRIEVVRMLKRQLKALAKKQGQVTSDDVYEILAQKDIPYYPITRSLGTLFKSDEWINTGKKIPSRRINNNHRKITVWRLKDRFDVND